MKTTNYLKSSSKWIVYLIILGILLWGTVSFFLYNQYINRKNSYLEAEMEAFESKIYTTLEMYETFSKYVFINDIQKPDIFELMRLAKAEKYQGEETRERLYSLLLDRYNLLKNYDFRQLHFHTPEGDSFLRFHAPNKYGDNLMSVRETVRIANTEKRYVKAFEEGRIFNGYRFVYPLVDGNDHLGSVEVSISMASLIRTLSKLYPGTTINFFVSENVVESTVFKSEKSNYLETDIFEGYLLDKEIYNQNLNDLSEEVYEKNASKIKTVINEQSELINGDSSFSVLDHYKEMPIVLSFLSIKNIQGEHVAYLTGIHTVQNADIFALPTFIRELVTASLLFILFFVSIYVYSYKQKQLEEIATTDQLTGLINRHKFVEKAESAVAIYERYKRDVSIILLDLDHFKTVNDQFGHNIGDKILKETADILEDAIRKQDTVARWGGEEFIVLLPETKKDEALVVANRIRESIELYKYSKGIHLTGSLGVATLKDVSKVDLDVLIHSADEKMYTSKEKGRNKVTY